MFWGERMFWGVSAACAKCLVRELFHHRLHRALRTQEAAILVPAALQWWEIVPGTSEVPYNSLALMFRPFHLGTRPWVSRGRVALLAGH